MARAVLRMNVGCPIVTNGDFVACVKMHEGVELLFGVVSRIGPAIGVLDEGPHPQGEGEVLVIFLVHWF